MDEHHFCARDAVVIQEDLRDRKLIALEHHHRTPLPPSMSKHPAAQRTVDFKGLTRFVHAEKRDKAVNLGGAQQDTNGI